MSGINYQQIGKDLVESLKGKPYGSIPKKELDLLLFGILYNNNYYDGKSNYEISLELMISEARLDNLLYDMKLRQKEWQTIDAEELSKLISNFTFNKENGKFLISIPDKFTKNAIISKLGEEKIIYDFSFNDKLLNLDAQQYANILSLYLSEQQKDEILKIAKKQGFETGEFKDFMLSVLGVIVKNATDGAVSALLGPVNSVNSLFGLLSDSPNIFKKLFNKGN